MKHTTPKHYKSASKQGRHYGLYHERGQQVKQVRDQLKARIEEWDSAGHSLPSGASLPERVE